MLTSAHHYQLLLFKFATFDLLIGCSLKYTFVSKYTDSVSETPFPALSVNTKYISNLLHL